jgi:hypothetical protein
VVSVRAEQADPANESRLVHLSGLATTEETLVDPIFRIAEQAIRLDRKAETYQWVERKKSETRKKLGGGEETVTTYSYSKDWQEKRIDSGEFREPAGHTNPPSLPFESESWQAREVRVGGFHLSPALTSSMRRSVEVAFTQAGLDALSGDLRARARIHGTGLYVGRSPSSPAVGDVRVTFSKVPPGDVSVIAQQVGHHLGPYQTRAGDRIEKLETGIVSAAAMFKSAERANTLMTWVLRFAAFLVMMSAILMLLRPFRVLADVVPILGTLVGMGLGLVAFAVAAPLTLLTIAVAWIAHRPVVGIGLILVALAISGFVLVRFARKRRSLVPATAPA